MNFDFMVEMAWKSALISAFALSIAAALRFRPAAERSGVLRAAVALVLVLPLFTLLLPALPIVTRTVQASAGAMPLPMEMALIAPDPIAAAPASSLWDDPTPLIEILWAGGALMVLARLAAGLVTLARWTRGGNPIDDPAWTDALDRAAGEAGFEGPVRLLVADAPAPMSWGWLRPTLLIDRDTARNPDEAEAVLAHEMAHVARRDWLVLILARVAVALFWFNPLMWLLERRLIDEAEETADARALQVVEPARYAQTLLSCAHQAGRFALPAASIADRGLAKRVRAVLGEKLRRAAPNPRLTRIAMGACVLIAAPIAALKPVTATVPAPAAPVAPAASTPATAPESAAAPVAEAVAVADADAAPAPRPRSLTFAFAQPSQPPQPSEPAAAPEAPPAPPAPEAAPAPAAPPAPPAPRHRRSTTWNAEDGARMSRDIQRSVDEAMRSQGEAMRAAHRAMANMGPQIAQAMRESQQAMANMGPQIAQAMRESQQAMANTGPQIAQAMRESQQALRQVDREKIREVMRQAANIRPQIEAAMRARAEAMRQAQIALGQARNARRIGMTAGADGMEAGARGMEQGARQMEEAARNLHSKSYRDEQIARAWRDEHRRVTDAELLAAIPKLEQGAVRMHQGAETMRRRAQEMRTQHD